MDEVEVLASITMLEGDLWPERSVQVVVADLSGLDMFTAEAAVCRVEEPEARLGSLHSAAEAAQVAELLAGEAGLLGGLVTQTSTHWGDGTEWDYEDWAEGEPGVGT